VPSPAWCGEPDGLALAFVLGGAPAVVANLWDVSDKDIDAFTGGLLTAWALPTLTAGRAPLAATAPWQLAAAVQAARTKCKLGGLNGAAPITLGIPL